MPANPQPLYKQVREDLTARIADGIWKAGAVLPSEQDLAAELAVSPGTVRKAMNDMAADNLLVRQQGRGTFVAEHTEERALFHFFRMEDANGTPVTPQPLDQSVELVAPPRDIARALDSDRRRVWKIARLRGVGGDPAIVEHIYVDPRRMPALTADTELPNALYSYYQVRAGLTVAQAQDRLTAVAAEPWLARALGVKAGHPLLAARRRALGIRDDVIEIRDTWFRTEIQGYAITLR